MLRILQHFILTTLFAVFASQASSMFIQADWFDPNQPGVGTNRYAYSNNDPINKYDPSGNAWIDEGWDALFGEGSFDRTFGEGSSQALDNTADYISRANGAALDRLDYYGHSIDASTMGLGGKPVRVGAGTARLGARIGRLVRGTRAPQSSDIIPSDTIAGSVRDVNPTGSVTNCVNCAIATDNRLAGIKTSALPQAGRGEQLSVLEKLYGGRFQQVSGRSQIVETMIQAGPGARGIVAGLRKQGVGHVFNVVNQNGTVRFLDGQTGRAAEFNSDYVMYGLMRTNQ